MDLKNQSEKQNEVQESHEFWRYAVTVFLVVVFMIFAQIVIFGFAYLIEGNLDIFSYEPLTLLWVSMAPFAAVLVILLPSIRFLHHIPIRKIFTQKSHFFWKSLILSALVWFLLAIFSDILLSIFQKDNYSFNFNPKTFFPFLIATLLLIPIQITAEEVFFRGYLQPGFTRMTKSPWLGLIIQALFFGLLHGANTEVSVYGVLTTMPFYIGIGLLLGFITKNNMGLEDALGLHLANNIYASLIVTFEGSSIESPALFLIKDYQPVTSLILFFVTAIIYYFLMKFFHSRKKKTLI